MSTKHENEIRQAIAKAIAKEAGKNAEKVWEFAEQSDKAQFEKLIQSEAEKALLPKKDQSANPDSIVVPYVFRAPPQESSYHIKVSGLEKSFRDSISGKDIGNSIKTNLSISIEFVRLF